MQTKLVISGLALMILTLQLTTISNPVFAETPERMHNQILVKIKHPAYQRKLRSLARRVNAKSVKPMFAKSASYRQQRQHVMRTFARATNHNQRLFNIKQLKELHNTEDRIRNRKSLLKRQTPAPRLDLSYVLTFKYSINVEAYANYFRRQYWVKSASPNYKIKRSGFPNTLPNDSFLDSNRDNKFDSSYFDPRRGLRSAQWGLERIGAHKAWKYGTGRNVIVAVLDDGIDPEYPDLKPNILKNTAETPGNGIDDDCNGFIDDYLGVNILSDNNTRTPQGCAGDDARSGKPGPYPHEYHGNSVASVIAAKANNRFGISGVAPDAKILAVRVIGDGESSTIDVVARGIRYATDRGADVINMSLGAVLDSRYSDGIEILSDAIQYAKSKGVILVAAAGNDGVDARNTYPGAHPDVISVASTNYERGLSYFSNHGNTVDIAAPGSDILVGIPAHIGFNYDNEPYSFFDTPERQKSLHTELSGTSFSSPLVAGTAALILSVDPTATARQIRSALHSTDKPISLSNGTTLGTGELNSLGAVEKFIRAVEPCRNNVNPFDVNGDSHVTPIDALNIVNWIDGSLDFQRVAVANGICADITGDGIVSPLDALRVVNQINLLND